MKGPENTNLISSEPKGSHNMKNDQWGQDIVKARLTQQLRGEDMNSKQRIVQLVSHIITAILSGLAGFFGGGM